MLFCVTGCEHAIGTWLPTFGHEAGVARSAMALMARGWASHPQPSHPPPLAPSTFAPSTPLFTLYSLLCSQSSVFWGAICVGRLLWAAFSHAASTGWLVLALNASAMLLASVLCGEGGFQPATSAELPWQLQ